MQLFMKTSVVSVINLEKSMYLVLQALLVVCVYLSSGCSDFQARPSVEVTVYNHGLIKNNLTLFVLYASVVLVHQSCSSFIVLNKKKTVLLFSTWVRWSMTMWNDCLHTVLQKHASVLFFQHVLFSLIAGPEQEVFFVRHLLNDVLTLCTDTCCQTIPSINSCSLTKKTNILLKSDYRMRFWLHFFFFFGFLIYNNSRLLFYKYLHMNPIWSHAHSPLLGTEIAVLHYHFIYLKGQ